MILFIAPNPNRVEKREGFLQRVAAIDSLFADEDKVYIEDYTTIESQAAVIAKANLVYVHSTYSAKWIRSLYPLLTDKIVTDLHGVVPEEEELQGNEERFKIMSEVEAEVFTFCKTFVAVSGAMVDHYVDKYQLANDVKWIILPIYDETEIIDVEKKTFDKTVVYAGGAQKWQNVDRMVQSINASSDFNYVILTHDPQSFSGINEEKIAQVSLRTVASNEVSKYYQNASLGFLLRDDNIVNRVACPTKLIEYMGSGVVPVVISPNIGDAKKLGYSYVTLEEFENRPISKKRLANAAKRNTEVLRLLHQQSEAGKKDLIKLAKSNLPSDENGLLSPKLDFYLSLYESYEKLINEAWALKETIRKHEYEIVVNQATIKGQQEFIDRVKKSKVFQLAQSIRRIGRRDGKLPRG